MGLTQVSMSLCTVGVKPKTAMRGGGVFQRLSQIMRGWALLEVQMFIISSQKISNTSHYFVGDDHSWSFLSFFVKWYETM